MKNIREELFTFNLMQFANTDSNEWKFSEDPFYLKKKWFLFGVKELNV